MRLRADLLLPRGGWLLLFGQSQLHQRKLKLRAPSPGRPEDGASSLKFTEMVSTQSPSKMNRANNRKKRGLTK
jgi:hypothetical protein